MRLSILLLAAFSVLSSNTHYDVKKIRTMHGLNYQLAHQRFLMVYVYGDKLSREEYNILVDTCNKKPFCTGGFRVLTVSFYTPELQRFFDDYKITHPGTGIVFVNGDPIPGTYFTEDLTRDSLDNYLATRVGDDVKTFIDELDLGEYHHAQQRGTGQSWYWGGYYPSWGAYPTWGSQPWGAFSLGMGFRRPQN